MKNIESSKTFQEKVKKITLRDYYNSLPSTINPRNAFIKDVCENCGVSLQTARNWIIYGMKPNDSRSREYLSKVTDIPIENLW